MNRFAAITTPFLLGSAALQAQPAGSVRLAPGDAAVVRLDGSTVTATVRRGEAQWTPLDLAAARHMSGLAPIDTPANVPVPLPAEQMPPAPPIVPGEIRMRLHDIAGRHTMLIIENGYGRALVFHAEMTTALGTMPTDVCLVVPNDRSFEHWPDPISRLELSQFVQVDWQEGDPVPCR